MLFDRREKKCSFQAQKIVFYVFSRMQTADCWSDKGEGKVTGRQCCYTLIALTLFGGVLATLQLQPNSKAVVLFYKNQIDCHLSN